MLCAALADRSNRVVTKAADLCGEFGTSDLLDDLLNSYQLLVEECLSASLGPNATQASAIYNVHLIINSSDASDVSQAIPSRIGSRVQSLPRVLPAD